jgi:hypothetical protein
MLRRSPTDHLFKFSAAGIGSSLRAMIITKRSFVRGSVGVCVAGVMTAACGGDDDDDDTSSGGACTTQIASNHGHALTVSAADKMTGAAKEYDIKGSADHSHTVSLSAEDFADLASGTILIMNSSTDAGHEHEVTITC